MWISWWSRWWFVFIRFIFNLHIFTSQCIFTNIFDIFLP
ncbi:unnamed protein product [Schistosoma margrebowiei]|uniref:Uncharacterized protein n=1 Tax=Schistosoma margrebowiei TaxID=48269 RepID=A0A183M5Y5_9TREM|nr:unnamed protein product [Schistosoma margrebowiei]